MFIVYNKSDGVKMCSEVVASRVDNQLTSIWEQVITFHDPTYAIPGFDKGVSLLKTLTPALERHDFLNVIEGTNPKLTLGQHNFSKFMVFPHMYTSLAICLRNTGTQSSTSLEIKT